MRLLLLLAACGGPKSPIDTGTAEDTSADSADTGEDSGEGSDSGGDSGEDSDSGGDSGEDSDTGEHVSEDPIDVPEDNLVNALGDCAGLQRAPDEYPNQLVNGDELERYTLHEADAVCNDGSRAVVYVRGYTDEAFADVWELHLQGGGVCSGWVSCAQRWCGLDYYDSSKMSSENLPDRIGAFGILDEGAENVLSGANHVFFYYCSSDAWGGEGSISYTVPEDGEDTGGASIPEGLPDYTMFTRGHTIVEAAIDELEDGVTGDLGEVLPSLRDASVVIFNGTSGGSSGAGRQADWLSERLAGNGTNVFAVLDAGNAPPPDYFAEPYASALAERYSGAWTAKVAQSDVPPFVDESCWAELGGTAEEWLCDSQPYVFLNHLTTPFFVRQDLRDTTDGAEAVGLSEDEWETAVADMLGDLAHVQDNGTEGADVTVVPGAYGPNCAQHVAMETNPWWLDATVRGNDGVDYSFQDAVVAWYQGDLVQVIDDPVTGDGPGPRSTCEEVDEEH